MTYLFHMSLSLYYLAFCDSMKHSFAYQEKNFVNKYLMLVSLRFESPSMLGGSVSKHLMSLPLLKIPYRFRPGLCPNWSRLSPHDGMENCRTAMQIAERYIADQTAVILAFGQVAER
jgi:hypothetical protein